jgi:hypothetical protein
MSHLKWQFIMGSEALGDSRFGIGDPRLDSLSARREAARAAAASADTSANSVSTSGATHRRSVWRVIAPLALLAAAAGVGDAVNVNTTVEHVLVGGCAKVETGHTYKPGENMEEQVRRYDPNGDWRAGVDCTIKKNGLPSAEVKADQKASIYVRRQGIFK